MGVHSARRQLCLLALGTVFSALTGCASYSGWRLSPSEEARAALASAGFRSLAAPSPEKDLSQAHTALLTAVRNAQDTRYLTVFIEGDGAAWFRASVPPADPTPTHPLALYLAAAHSPGDDESVAYLGRPCQYLTAAALNDCPVQWWTVGRFGTQPLALMNDAIDRIKASSPAAQLRLVGYSGGGSVAALLAQQRSDVACLVTVAAPLDTDAWTRAKNVSPLVESLNPLTMAAKLKGMMMSHLSGDKDTVVPLGTNQKFFELAQTQTTLQAGFDHTRPWLQAWPQLALQTCLAR